jgi:hypothetical protein
MQLYFKYQSSNTFSSIDIAQGKVFQNYVKVQDQGHKVKSLGTERKVSSSCFYFLNTKAICLKDIAQVKVFQNWVKVQNQKSWGPFTMHLYIKYRSLIHLFQKI